MEIKMNEALILSKNILGELLPESSISEEGLQKICDRLPELQRAKRAVGRRNSQTTSTLMTMTMIADSPYRQMKQCLSQIDTKRNALIEAHFRTKKNKVKIERWEKSGDELDAVEAEEARVGIEQSRTAAENAMKEIGMYQDIYEQIRTSHNIPVDWDEEDYEKTEIDHALRMGFRQAIQNLMSSGRIAISTVEYWEQFGVHPMVGEKLTKDYLGSVEAEMKGGKLPSVVSMHKFLDSMVETFKDEHKHSLTRIGVDAIINHQYAYKK
tara:strand:- start:22 stop:825 length:804 start_codon:yes stop_codon:yes gene_type:complete